MENLVKLENNQIVADSRIIAQSFEKEHRNVVQSIEKLKAENLALTSMFHETTYKAGTGKNYKMYLMNRDGFSLLVMGFTGKKALEWKLKYINAFNEMEAQLKAKQNTASPLQTERIKMMSMNARTRQAGLWLKIAQNTGITEYKEICNAYAANTLADKEVFALPQVEQKTYTATEVGEQLGISAHRVGKIAKQNSLKTELYGKWFYDKSRYSGKQVETFRYNKDGVEAIRKALNTNENSGKIIGYEEAVDKDGNSIGQIALVQK